MINSRHLLLSVHLLSSGSGGRTKFIPYSRLCFFAFVLSFSIGVSSASADNSSSQRSLFSGKAAEKVEQKHRRGVGSGDRSESFYRTYSAQDAAELDTVDEILDSRRGQDFLHEYRGPFYMSYVYDAFPIGEFDAWDSESVAERAAIYQAATTFSQIIVRSALEPIYRRALDAVSWFRHYTSVKVRREGDGNLGLSKHAEKEKPLMEFKLHVSMNNGVEPRINIGDNCTLRYDVIRQDAIIEFRQDF